MIFTPKIERLKKQLAWRCDELAKALKEQRFADAKEHELEAGQIKGFIHVYSVLLDEFPYLDRADELLDMVQRLSQFSLIPNNGKDDNGYLPNRALELVNKISVKE